MSAPIASPRTRRKEAALVALLLTAFLWVGLYVFGLLLGANLFSNVKDEGILGAPDTYYSVWEMAGGFLFAVSATYGLCFWGALGSGPPRNC